MCYFSPKLLKFTLVYDQFITIMLNVINTTISVSSEVRDKLKQIGSKAETYDDILTRLMKK